MFHVVVAIEYLHHSHNTPIVHCDLNPLLYKDMVAHVGDFGISMILAVNKSMEHTETLGTLGYIAAEYGSDGMVSASGDVYSYGIMFMEVLAKRRLTDEEIFNENLGLREWIRRAFPRTIMDVVDANLFSEEEQITSKSAITMELAAESAFLAKLDAITRQWEVINERLDHMGVPREQVGYPDTRQDEDRSSCELRGKSQDGEEAKIQNKDDWLRLLVIELSVSSCAYFFERFLLKWYLNEVKP
ncbi:receptor kinase-like protein Xa21 [Capsicum annuum]|uniref:receptor kinase-like protein Xa21 n=1 Tax=Capsicum annuum TaxID=4072 RepID=UPI001FB1601A|nr:receptor kinase-like protein Xa21 [Capsicum annuum]